MKTHRMTDRPIESIASSARMAGHSLFSTVTRLVTVRSQFGNSCMANRVKTHSLELIDSIKKVRLNPSHPSFVERAALVADGR